MSTENQKLLSHQEFVEKYKEGAINAHVNKQKAGDFVLSERADKHNKPAHLFWTWTGIILTFVAPIALLFLANWIYALISFFLGLVIQSAARKSAAQFVLKNALDNEDFWEYCLLHGGLKLTDTDGSEFYSKWLSEMAKKHQSPQPPTSETK